MTTRALLLLIGGCLVAQSARAQDPPNLEDRTGYRKFFDPPTATSSATDWWDAISFELEAGRFDFAAEHLKNFMQALALKEEKAKNQDLVSLHALNGITPYLRMSYIKTWYVLENLAPEDRLDHKTSLVKRKRIDDQLVTWNARAQADAKKLFADMITAVEADRGDKKSIEEYVDNLTGAPPEIRKYSLERLRDKRDLAIPHIITLMGLRKPPARAPILEVLPTFRPATVPPLIAALDMDEEDRRLDILSVLLKTDTFRAMLTRESEIPVPDKMSDPESASVSVVDPLPYLWAMADPKQPSEALRKAALELLSRTYQLKINRLPKPHEALTYEAERFYQRQVGYLKRPSVSMWLWDKSLGNVTKRDFTSEQARKYFVLKYARRALAMEPTYRPAQMVLLAFAIDEGFKLPGHGPMMPGSVSAAVQPPPGKDPPMVPPMAPANPIGQLDPKLKDVLSKLSTDLLLDLLERGLRTNDTKLILAPVRILGERKQVEAAMAGPQGESLLVKALLYGDPRVQIAAADSLLTIPGALTEQRREQIIEAFRRMIQAQVAATGRSKMVIAIKDPQLRAALEDFAIDAEFDVVKADNGRDVLKRVLEAADVNVIFLDPTIEKPGYARVVAQIANDRFAHRVPIFMPAIPSNTRSQTILDRRKVAIAELRRELDAQQITLSKEEARILEYRVGKGLEEMPDRFAVAQQNRIDQLKAYLTRLSMDYDKERFKQLIALRSLTKDKKNVIILDDRFADDPVYLSDALRDAVAQTNVVPLSPAERENFAERALAWLDRMARGELRGLGQIANPAQRMSSADAERLQKLEELLLKAMESPNLDYPARKHAVSIVSRLGGADVQRGLISLAMKTVKVENPEEQSLADDLRVAAITAVQEQLQKNGIASPAQYAKLRADVAAATKNQLISLKVQQALSLLQGNLNASDRSDGARVLELNP